MRAARQAENLQDWLECSDAFRADGFGVEAEQGHGLKSVNGTPAKVRGYDLVEQKDDGRVGLVIDPANDKGRTWSPVCHSISHSGASTASMPVTDLRDGIG